MEPVTVEVTSSDGRTIINESAVYRAFESGSLGYNVNGRVTIEGRTFQSSMSLTEIHSKERTDDEAKGLRAAFAVIKAERDAKASAGNGALATEREKNRALEARLAALEAKPEAARKA